MHTDVLSIRFSKLLDCLSGLRKLSHLGNQRLSKQVLLDEIMRTVYEYLEAEIVTLYLQEDDELHRVAILHWEQFTNNRSGICKDYVSTDYNQGLLGKAIINKKVIHIDNCAENNVVSISDKDYKKGAVIYAPIMTNDELLGVVELYHPHEGHFSAWQEHSIVIYCDMIGMLIANNRLLEDMQSVVNSRTSELQRSLKECEKLRSKYEEMSIIDHLTKLYNRRFFFNEVASGLSRASRYNQPFSLLIMDLDFFKNINDQYGHECGDYALQCIAGILSRFTREGDTLARYGGEEFVLALPNTNGDGANKLAERIRQTVQENVWEWEQHSFSMTISIGLTSTGQVSDDIDDFNNYSPQVADLIREADRALYFVKQNGRNNVKAFIDLPKT